ncbi:MAG: HD domain-containing protein [Nitrospinota bacterium]|uniref:HD domain-containing protein n=1 Tax=marine metagenome TaxID=408172 RepID=A0A382GXS8_9ZZZZ|nr:HD domain-containing protein [Nitrospinota bacterium]|tara:strand:- start:730 stop:1380 length:651 start_codon:yes stop_codon:yes gene_type:complete
MTPPIIDKTCRFVEEKLAGEGSGHDWWHIYRVWNLAKNIAGQEGANLIIVELSALLHDIADWKFHNGDDSIGPKLAEQFLVENQVERRVIDPVIEIITSISYKGAGVPTPMNTLEGKVVQDADRLDAIGALGIARTFAYGGHKNRLIYHPEEKPVLHQSFEDYKKNQGHTINHFYEKLLLLKDRMNTASGKRLAEARHQFMQAYLDQFYKEWDGNA